MEYGEISDPGVGKQWCCDSVTKQSGKSHVNH